MHWLPIAQRIDYKISSLCYDVWDTAPLYLSDLLCLYVPSCSLRSSADTRIFRIPSRKKKFKGQRAFSHLGPVTWNKLPYSVRHAQTKSQFKIQLKTTLFRSVYEPDSTNQTLRTSLCVQLLTLLFPLWTCMWPAHVCDCEQVGRERVGALNPDNHKGLHATKIHIPNGLKSNHWSFICSLSLPLSLSLSLSLSLFLSLYLPLCLSISLFL